MENTLTDEQLLKVKRLDSFGQKLSEKRKTAVDARASSGIEQVWREDEEFREGIDDANRDKMSSVALKNNYETANGHGYGQTQSKHRGSTVFLNITAPYIANAVASLSDMLMPTDDQPFRVDPTPIPFLKKDIDSTEHLQGADGQRYSVADLAKQLISDAKEKAQAAQKQLEDYLDESKFNAEIRKVLDDVVGVGVGVLKGPFPIRCKGRKITRENGITKLTIVEETRQASKRISYWDFYPDPSCGDSIHNGSYTWEKDKITARQLVALKGMKNSDGGSYYIDAQIDKIIKEGPLKKHDMSGSEPSLADKFTIWYYYGTANKADLDACDCECDDNISVDVLVIMINDRVIKASIHTLDSGEFPYDAMCYQALSNNWVGKGLARQIRECQRIINAAIRNLLDNAGIGGSPILVLASGVESDDGEAIEFKRGLVLRVQPEAMIQDARQAVQPIVIPIITNDLIAIFQLAQKMAEDVTGMPMILQGQQGSAPETVGGMQMLEANSSATRRNIAKLFDDRVIVPHVTRYYEWLMIHGEDDSAKGDFQISARGSTVLFERDAARQALTQLGQAVANPAFGFDPKRWAAEMCKASRIDKESISFTDEEIKQQQELAQQQPPQDPAMALAKVKGEFDMQHEQLRQQGAAKDVEARLKISLQELSFKSEQAVLDRQHELQIENLRYQMEMMRLAQASDVSLQQIKADLAMTTNKLSVQKQLSAQVPERKYTTNGMEAIKPAVEPFGRADNGHSFEQ